MTTPSGPILGGVHLNDGANTKFRWNQEVGLSSPAARAVGSIQSTFAGPVLIAPQPTAYTARAVSLPGYLLQVNGLSQGYDRLERLYLLAGTAGTVSILQMGLLGLRVIPEPPAPEQLKAHSMQLDYTIRAQAVPAVWTALYGSYLGSTYGLAVNGESSSSTAFSLAAGASPSVVNPGTAACPLVLTISGRTTQFYIRVTAPGYTRKIAVTPQTGGVTRVTEADGLFVPPGTSTLRYEDSAGALITGVIASNIYGTRWRYEGLPVELEDAGPAILYNTRQQRGYAATSAFTTSAGLTLYGPDEPRFGNSGTYDANDAGLIVEPDRTNICLQSQALGTTWVQAGTITVTNNNGTAPDGTTTGTRVQLTAGSLGSVSQSITLTVAPYVVSFYARSTAAGSQDIQVSMGTVLAVTTVTTGTNWARYQYLVNGTAAAHTLSFASYEPSPMIYNAADVQIWGVQVELATGQTSAVATSYIPTTSATQRRQEDIIGVRPLENLLAWSNRFDKTTASSSTRGLWYVSGATVTTATLQAGPSGITDAASINFTVAGQYVQQDVLNCENLSGKTVSISIWVRNATSTPDSDFNLRIDETSSSSGFTSNSLANLDDKWRRVTVERKLSTGVTSLKFMLIAPSGTINVYVAHAHLYVASEGTNNLVSTANSSVTAPYVETLGSPYYGDKSWTWPSWLTQNGYIESDICLSETANPNSSTRILLGITSGMFVNSFEHGAIYRGGADGSASNIIRFIKSYVGGNQSGSYTPAAPYFDGTYRKFRLEWVNYISSAGSRVMNLRLYVDGVNVATTATTGTSWGSPPSLYVNHAGASVAFQTMRNFAIGVPSLPAGAIPEPY